MQETLHRLVYYSRNAVTGTPEALADSIDAILASSKRNNMAANVTGALMFNAGCFGQVLEGERTAVQFTFERIQGDRRHKDVSMLAFESIEARVFGHWSMGFVGTRAVDAAAFAHVASSSGFDPSKANGDSLLRALRKLAMDEETRRQGGLNGF